MKILQVKSLLIIIGVILVLVPIIWWMFPDYKPEECRQLLSRLDQEKSIFDQYKLKNDPSSTTQLANQLKQLIKEQENHKFRDKTLKKIHLNRLEILNQLAQTLTNIGQVLAKAKEIEPSLVGRQQLNQAKVRIIQSGEQAKQLAKQQDKITKEAIDYCQTTEVNKFPN